MRGYRFTERRTAMSTSGFGWDTTAEEATAGIDLHGINALVTGGTSGIGAETARVLAGAGAHVTMTGRNLQAGREIATSIAGEHPGAVVDVAGMELSDPKAVADFVMQWRGPLHLLINNAGIMALPERTLNKDGHELQFATNHLGHFALATGLHKALAAGAQDPAATVLGGARVVSLSSRGHLRADIDFDDINFEHRLYDPLTAYGQSKTANILFAVEAARRWANDGITANAVHPGAILETGLSRHMPQQTLTGIQATNKQAFKTIGQGAATSVVVATSNPRSFPREPPTSPRTHTASPGTPSTLPAPRDSGTSPRTSYPHSEHSMSNDASRERSRLTVSEQARQAARVPEHDRGVTAHIAVAHGGDESGKSATGIRGIEHDPLRTRSKPDRRRRPRSAGHSRNPPDPCANAAPPDHTDQGPPRPDRRQPRADP
jgi:NAD(P)-dependent dehydrogenase (short-subunit alcohol dehydrogenase family)